MPAAQELAVGHARHQQVVGELGLADHLGPGVDLGQRLADDREAILLHVRAPLMRRAASSTASRILVYPVHRHRLPARACLISSRVGMGISTSRASAVRRMPGLPYPPWSAPHSPKDCYSGCRPPACPLPSTLQ